MELPTENAHEHADATEPVPRGEAAACPSSADRGGADPGEAGAGWLAFAEVAGQTALVRCRAESPLKLLAPRRRGLSAWVCQATFGGGLVSGDRLHLDVAVGEGATALVATQAQTRVFRARAGGEARQDLVARVGDGGLLVLLPDPVCPFAGSRFTQRQQVQLAPGGTLVLLDGVIAGRVARGERWAFGRYASRTEVRVAGRAALVDAVLLAPRPGRATSDLAERLGRFDALATLVLMGPRAEGAAAALVEDLGREPAASGAGLLAAASAVAGGAVVRAAAARPEELRAWMAARLGFVAGLLGDDPFTHRW